MTESLDTAPEICYTKQKRKPRTILEAKNTLFAGEEKRIRASQESQNLLIAFSLYGNELPMELRYCCFMELYKQQSVLECMFVLLLQEKRRSPLPRGKPWTLL